MISNDIILFGFLLTGGLFSFQSTLPKCCCFNFTKWLLALEFQVSFFFSFWSNFHCMQVNTMSLLWAGKKCTKLLQSSVQTAGHIVITLNASTSSCVKGNSGLPDEAQHNSALIHCGTKLGLLWDICTLCQMISFPVNEVRYVSFCHQKSFARPNFTDTAHYLERAFLY